MRRAMLGATLCGLLCSCALTPSRPVGVVVRSEPDHAMIFELGTERALHRAPAAIYYAADELPEDYGERNCFRVAGFAAVWASGPAARTPALVDICRDGDAPAELVLRQPPFSAPAERTEPDLEAASTRYREGGEATPLRCLRVSVAEGFALVCS